MRVVIFCHSLISDWNHGNAHFLRGVSSELLARGHEVAVYEPEDAWSVQNLVRDHGTEPIEELAAAYPELSSRRYRKDRFDLDLALDGADLVLVHEWNDPELVRRIGEHRARSRSYRLLFHDTHHRMVSRPEEMARFDLRDYDGVLAFGRVISELYLARGIAARAWAWHEAADTRVFAPPSGQRPRPLDLVWIGNWGDDERTEEIEEFLVGPVSALGLKSEIHGVRYPESALRALAAAGIRYRGWIANFKVPRTFARARLTLHIPRRPYARQLPGIPTIRVFEALACGIPLICAPWDDDEALFKPGSDYLVARDGREMRERMRSVLSDEALARELSENGRRAILGRHTCGHRVDELLAIHGELRS